MPRRSSSPAVIPSHRVCFPFSFPAIATCAAYRPSSHHSRSFRRRVRVAVVLALFVVCGNSNARPVAAAQSAVTSKSDRIERFVAEAALRFGIPASWITAVMQAESRGAVRAVSPKGAMGL
jgi:soluble lytic murein transglycosylase-like protein